MRDVRSERAMYNRVLLSVITIAGSAVGAITLFQYGQEHANALGWLHNSLLPWWLLGTAEAASWLLRRRRRTGHWRFSDDLMIGGRLQAGWLAPESRLLTGLKVGGAIGFAASLALLGGARQAVGGSVPIAEIVLLAGSLLLLRWIRTRRGLAVTPDGVAVDSRFLPWPSIVGVWHHQTRRYAPITVGLIEPPPRPWWRRLPRWLTHEDPTLVSIHGGRYVVPDDAIYEVMRFYLDHPHHRASLASPIQLRTTDRQPHAASRTRSA